MKLVARTYASLENLLAKEIKALGGEKIKTRKRAVEFEGDKRTLYKVNLHSRFAIDVLTPISYFTARSPEDLYKGVQKVIWKKYLSVDQTFSITPIVHSKNFNHSKFAALKAKDAIVDQFRNSFGRRPNVDRDNADLKIVLRISDHHCHLLLNSSGEPLFKRGYRVETGKAPINEILAAAVLEFTGWDGSEPLVDPMCGSGTLPIEAGMRAFNIPAGHLRRQFGFHKWKNFDKELWEKIKVEADNNITVRDVDITGFDVEPRMHRVARKNLSSIPELMKAVKLKRADFFEEKGSDSLVIFNPPYDKRIKLMDANEFYSNIGSHLKHNWIGSNAWIISSNLSAIKRLGLRPKKKITLFNGPDESRLVHIPLYEGSKKDLYPSDNS